MSNDMTPHERLRRFSWRVGLGREHTGLLADALGPLSTRDDATTQCDTARRLVTVLADAPLYPVPLPVWTLDERIGAYHACEAGRLARVLGERLGPAGEEDPTFAAATRMLRLGWGPADDIHTLLINDSRLEDVRAGTLLGALALLDPLDRLICALMTAFGVTDTALLGLDDEGEGGDARRILSTIAAMRHDDSPLTLARCAAELRAEEDAAFSPADDADDVSEGTPPTAPVPAPSLVRLQVAARVLPPPWLIALDHAACDGPYAFSPVVAGWRLSRR